MSDKGQKVSFFVKTVSKDDILRVNEEGTWMYRGMPLSNDVVAKLKEEAKIFYGSMLWNILKNEVQWQGQKKLMEEGKEEIDIRAAQLLGYLTQVVDEKLKRISK